MSIKHNTDRLTCEISVAVHALDVIPGFLDKKRLKENNINSLNVKRKAFSQ